MTDNVLSNGSESSHPDILLKAHGFSTARRVIWIIARVIGIFRAKSFHGLPVSANGSDLLQRASDIILVEVQKSISDDVADKREIFKSRSCREP